MSNEQVVDHLRYAGRLGDLVTLLERDDALDGYVDAAEADREADAARDAGAEEGFGRGQEVMQMALAPLVERIARTNRCDPLALDDLADAIDMAPSDLRRERWLQDLRDRPGPVPRIMRDDDGAIVRDADGEPRWVEVENGYARPIKTRRPTVDEPGTGAEAAR